MRPFYKTVLFKQSQAANVVAENEPKQGVDLQLRSFLLCFLKAGFPYPFTPVKFVQINAYFYSARVSRTTIKGIKTHPACVCSIASDYPKWTTVRIMSV